MPVVVYIRMEKNEELEERITSLETRISFQDHTIDQLNSVVTNQQNQIDDLVRRLTDLVDQVKPLASVENDTSPPPHY